ncbi:acyltransferase [Aeoliella sp. ICT_H6.2]|uniref:Acyltransferase n=1 Tax=Aeoliella straminimaris TaxID=2954799 RepID=A0A9X2F998_9BACT|nr:acyltransferase [Aeoliella straminimaris]MCO6044735.1 acyltransferase [Aeoliella straminimaris]
MSKQLPQNVLVGEGTRIQGQNCFNRFFSEHSPALTIGSNCMIANAHFALGAKAQMQVGDECLLSSPMFLCEERISIGSRVVMGWNVAVMDTDFHPLDPDLRKTDAIACSPLAGGISRPAIDSAPVTIGDDVWIGPQATILKGTSIGSGSFIEPGTMVTQDVPAGSRVSGNPGRCTPLSEFQ